MAEAELVSLAWTIDAAVSEATIIHKRRKVRRTMALAITDFPRSVIVKSPQSPIGWRRRAVLNPAASLRTSYGDPADAALDREPCL
ncbi:hypothetical protein [Sphingobium cupriresistens]|uniref:hypothetical protein n=1 Tax=Sphingobium cupriresistens TaxID=1132417 RepID=UPI0011E05C9A|nr:hypothetical protein [Sphingobium cupriresistens]